MLNSISKITENGDFLMDIGSGWMNVSLQVKEMDDSSLALAFVSAKSLVKDSPLANMWREKMNVCAREIRARGYKRCVPDCRTPSGKPKTWRLEQ